MAECIERKALIEKLRTMPIPKQAGRANTWLDNCAAGVNAAIWEVASFPSADVAPVVHGRWEHLGGDEWCCSACGFVLTTEGSWDKPTKKYCEDCGAMMDGGADHEAD